jgi:hypothetical protein
MSANIILAAAFAATFGYSAIALAGVDPLGCHMDQIELISPLVAYSCDGSCFPIPGPSYTCRWRIIDTADPVEAECSCLDGLTGQPPSYDTPYCRARLVNPSDSQPGGKKTGTSTYCIPGNCTTQCVHDGPTPYTSAVCECN